MKLETKAKTAPAFALKDQWGACHTLDSMLGTKPLILAFHRFYGCVLCQYDLDQLNAEYPSWQDRYALAAVVQTPDDQLKASEHLRQFCFPVLADPEGLVYRAYEIPTAPNRDAMMDEASAAKVAAIKAAGYLHGTDTGNPLQLPAMLLIEPGTRRILASIRCEKAGAFPTIAELLDSQK